MRRLQTVLMILVLGWATGSSAHNALAKLIPNIRPSVVAVGFYDPSGRPRQTFLGTGFVVGNGHQVITNYHVLPEDLDASHKQKIAVFSGRGKRVRFHEARVLASDPGHDLALLYISTPLPALKLAPAGSAREGHDIAFTGFPLGMVLGLYPVSHRGMISAIAPLAPPQITSKTLTPAMIKRMRKPSQMLQLDATAYPGNSGSPVYDAHNGQVLGVINSVFVKGTKEAAISNPSGITYAIPVRHVHALLKKAGN